MIKHAVEKSREVPVWRAVHFKSGGGKGLAKVLFEQRPEVCAADSGGHSQCKGPGPEGT